MFACMPTSPRLPNVPLAAVQRLAILALDVLEEAYREAREKPISRTSLHRLALGYLMLTGCAGAGQVTILWRVLGHEGVFEQMPCRQSHFSNIVHGIKGRVRKLTE